MQQERILSQTKPENYNVNFLKGIFYLWHSKYKLAKELFLSAVNETDPLETYYPVYLSYLGLIEILNQKNSGLHRCYESSEIHHNNIDETEIILNMACAEFMTGNRSRGIRALDKLNQLRFSRGHHSLTIQCLSDLVGLRKTDNKGTQRRNKIMHKCMGKIFRKHNNINSSKYELFIKETVKRRYENIIKNLYGDANIQASIA